MQSIALVIHVILAVVVIGLVLMQHGKGADAGAAFGSGASATVFGARGATSFLTRMTTLTASLFFATSVLLFWLAAHRDSAVRSVTDVPGLVEDAPAAPGAAPGVAPGATLPAATLPASDLPGGVEPDAGSETPPPAAPAGAEPAAGQARPAAPVVPVATPADASDAGAAGAAGAAPPAVSTSDAASGTAPGAAAEVVPDGAGVASPADAPATD